jgi:subtilisin family serine protease
MIRALLAAWLLAWCALAAAAPAEDSATAAPRQVLVLVPMPPPHFRPDGAYGGGYVDAAGRAAGRRTAAALARSYGLRMATDWPMPALGLDCYVMDVPEPLQAADVAARLAHERGVAWAQVMNVFQVLGHDDPLFEQQPAAQQWHLAELHESVMGRGVRVAVVDSGVQADHPDLAGQVAERMNLLPERADAPELHGTAVAGIIAARADNRLGIAGVAPLARLVALRACWQVALADTRCNSLSLALALSAAVDRSVDVLNLSLGGPPDRLVQRLIEAAQARGITVVAARNGALAGGGFPAALPGVVAVGDRPSPTPPAGLSAPGADVLTTLPTSRWGLVSGSSYAAAHVSGLVALMIEARGRGAPVRVRAPAGADFVAGPDGHIDACATLQRVAQSCVCTCGTAALADSVARP